MKEKTKGIAVLYFCGLIFGLGMKCVDWVIPRPPAKVEVLHSVDDDNTCLRQKEPT